MAKTFNSNCNSRYFLSTNDKDQKAIYHRASARALLSSVFINLTYRCNLDCAICLVKDRYATRKKQELDFSTVRKFLDEAVSMGVLNVAFSGGEILAREDFEDIYVYAIKKGCLVSIYSNITLLDKRKLDLFQKYPPDRMQVSIFGLSKETYEKITRVPGSFDLFIKNLALLRERRIRLILHFPLCSSNEKDYKGFLNGFPKESYENKTISFYLFKHTGLDVRRNVLIEQEMLPADRVAYYKVKHDSFPPYNRKIITKQNKLFWKCRLKKEKTLSINPLGECSVCYEMPTHKYKLPYKPGKLKEIVEILCEERNNAAMPDIKCRDCTNLLYCQWCPLYAYTFTGRIAPIPYFCEVMKASNLLGANNKRGGILCSKTKERKSMNRHVWKKCWFRKMEE